MFSAILSFLHMVVLTDLNQWQIFFYGIRKLAFENLYATYVLKLIFDLTDKKPCLIDSNSERLKKILPENTLLQICGSISVDLVFLHLS